MDIHKYTYICPVVFVMLGACTTGKYILYALYMHRVGHIMYRTWSVRCRELVQGGCITEGLQYILCVYSATRNWVQGARELASIII